ncbi:MAG: M3 family metallopeptidase, partial [Glutamicibacter sp.]
FDDAEELAGLSSQAIESAAQAAKQAGHASGYLLTLVSPTQQPVLESLASSQSRRKVFNASISRGTEENATNHVAAEMAQLRAERAALLGFANHAETVLAQATAPSTAAVEERLAELTKAATANARQEAQVLGKIAGAEINAWDWKYFSNQVLREEYSVDSEALRNYFELDRVLVDGVFATATKL